MSEVFTMQMLREKSVEELNKLLCTLKQERFKMRMKLSINGEVKTHRFSQIRKNIARIKTRLVEESSK